MKIREVKDEVIEIGPSVEEKASLEPEESAVANGVAVLNGGGANGEKDRHRGIEDTGGGKRKSSAASSSACGTHGTYAAKLTWHRSVSYIFLKSRVSLAPDFAFCAAFKS